MKKNYVRMSDYNLGQKSMERPKSNLKKPSPPNQCCLKCAKSIFSWYTSETNVVVMFLNIVMGERGKDEKFPGVPLVLSKIVDCFCVD